MRATYRWGFETPIRPLQRLAVRMPGPARSYHRVEEEIKILLYAVTSGLGRQAWLRHCNRSRRTRQRPIVWESSLPLPSGRGPWGSELTRQGIRCSEGDYAVYLPPQPGLAAKLGSCVAAYPEDAGYKIVKNPGRPQNVRYLGDLRRITWIQSTLVGTAQDQAPIANRLYDLSLGPRLYDVAQLNAGAAEHAMFVVQHVEGGCPTPAECHAFLERLEELVAAKQITQARPDWRREPDFCCPGCSGNLLQSTVDPSLSYIDFQNFLIPGYDRQLPSLSSSVSSDARRRWESIRSLLAPLGLGMSGRVFLHLGCGPGMVIAQALNEGASWSVGWDQPGIVAGARKLLSAQGYTRCHVQQYVSHPPPAAIARPMPADIPPHLAPILDQAILLASATEASGPIDPTVLAALPWRALVYEGGRHASKEEWAAVSRELQRVSRSQVVASADCRDGDSNAGGLTVYLRRAPRFPATEALL